MLGRISWVLTVVLLALASRGEAQVEMTGRLNVAKRPGGEERMTLPAIRAIANLDGPDNQALTFRTWETDPAGWYQLIGGPGRYTIMFSNPGHFMRPIVVTNRFVADGLKLDVDVSPELDYGVFDLAAWDDKRAKAYYQAFTARGNSVTQVGFRLVHDGVDGFGPGKQDLLVSIHRAADDTPPERWEQIGPAVPVVGVDSGGGKNYNWSAGWNSGEVAVTPGERYAVCLRAKDGAGGFQAFWSPNNGTETECYRVAGGGATGWTGHNLWMSVATDHDGLLIPYNKRVHHEFSALTTYHRKWSQAYVAQGRGLAGVQLYVATSGIQPGIHRQRARVTVRGGGPDGPVVGVRKIATGNGNHTGDASWGVFGVVFAPGEVELTPGKTYAIEWESIETYFTLHGYVNIKNMVSDDKPGFNPYRKHELDDYPHGTAYRDGREPMDFDLDMQVVEYAHAPADWAHAVEPTDLMPNGDMETGTLGEHATGWERFSLIESTAFQYLTDPPSDTNRLLRVGVSDEKPADGGYVRRVDQLDKRQAYRLLGRVRSSWPRTQHHKVTVGIDPTGQTDDPSAATIVWDTPGFVHGVFNDYRGEPIRPRDRAVSVWLRGQSDGHTADQAPFKADFDDFALHQVRTGVPTIEGR